MQITVVGAGVIGLTTALTLEEHGHEVRVVATGTAEATTSAVAGACWFPYRAGPPERVAAWAAHTRSWLEGFATERAAGIDPVHGYEITDEQGADPPRPWWAAGIDVTRGPAPVTGAPLAWRYRSVRIEPGRFLAWLTDRLRGPGARGSDRSARGSDRSARGSDRSARGSDTSARGSDTIERRPVDDLASEPGDVVVNCSGLAARELAGDDLVTPLFGQIVITELGEVDRSLLLTDERDPDRLFYMIPRREELVLGGCSLPWPPGKPPEIDPAITRRILDHARALGIAVGGIRRVRAGLRPYRPEVRLERTGRIVHNYGHGGAGYTLCRGCAEDVVRLIA